MQRAEAASPACIQPHRWRRGGGVGVAGGGGVGVGPNLYSNGQQMSLMDPGGLKRALLSVVQISATYTPHRHKHLILEYYHILSPSCSRRVRTFYRYALSHHSSIGHTIF
jgi:hypothetical protein